MKEVLLLVQSYTLASRYLPEGVLTCKLDSSLSVKSRKPTQGNYVIMLCQSHNLTWHGISLHVTKPRTVDLLENIDWWKFGKGVLEFVSMFPAWRRLNLTHAWVLLGAIRYDLYMVAVHVVAEEIIEVRLWPLTSEHIQTAVSLFKQRKDCKRQETKRQKPDRIILRAMWQTGLTVWKSMQCPMRDWTSSGPALHESSRRRLHVPAWQW